MSWQQLQNEGKVRAHRTSGQELFDLRSVIERDLDDAAIEALSTDRRFATAYNAVLQISKLVIACSGYRVAGQGHHMTTFQAVRLALGTQFDTLSTYFDSCRRKRNVVDYDMSGIVTETEVEELLKEAESYRQMAEDWIRQNYAPYGLPVP